MTGTSKTAAPSRGPRRQRNITLISLRINAGLSRQDLARRTGVSAETIRMAEHGITPSRPWIQFAIAKEFDLLPLDIWPLESQKATQKDAGRR